VSGSALNSECASLFRLNVVVLDVVQTVIGSGCNS
jgi:hypothetical protein